MEANSALKKKWILSPQAFAKLLAAFAPDAEQAGLEYEAARTRLIKLFRWRGINEAEEAADETLNRVARKLDEGEIVRDLSAFIGGIARFVLLEKLKSKERKMVALADAPPAVFVEQPEGFADTGSADEEKLRCFNGCLRGLPEETRQIVTDYYNADADGSVRIEHRKRLARRLGLEMNALRNRALRVRAKLEDCIKNCLGGSSGS